MSRGHRGCGIFSIMRIRLCASRAAADFLVNRSYDHRQHPIRNISHSMCGRDVVREFGENFFVGVAAGLKHATGNEIIAVKDSCHRESPNDAKREDAGQELSWMLGKPSSGVNSTRPRLKAARNRAWESWIIENHLRRSAVRSRIKAYFD